MKWKSKVESWRANKQGMCYGWFVRQLLLISYVQQIQVFEIKLIRITFRWSYMDDVKTSMFHVSDMRLQSREGGKNLESIQSSTTPDPGYRLGKWQIHKKHQIQEEPRSQPFHSRWLEGCMTQTRQYSKDKHKIRRSTKEVSSWNGQYWRV